MARVLVVDDEKSVRTTLGLFLSDDGHEVETAKDAEDALRFLDETSFDIVVTDIILPQKTGTELFRTICDTYPHIKVILITGEPNLSSATAAIHLGAFDYLVKPVRQEQICQAVKKAAEAKTLEEENRRLEEENRRLREQLEELTQKRDAE